MTHRLGSEVPVDETKAAAIKTNSYARCAFIRAYSHESKCDRRGLMVPDAG